MSLSLVCVLWADCLFMALSLPETGGHRKGGLGNGSSLSHLGGLAVPTAFSQLSVCGTRCEFYVLMVGGRVFTGPGGGEGFMPYRSVSLWPPLPTPTFRETQAPAKCISQAVTIGSGNRWNICRGDRGHLCSSPAGPHLHHHLSQHCPGWGEGQAQ